MVLDQARKRLESEPAGRGQARIYTDRRLYITIPNQEKRTSLVHRRRLERDLLDDAAPGTQYGACSLQEHLLWPRLLLRRSPQHAHVLDREQILQHVQPIDAVVGQHQLVSIVLQPAHER
jgi:hypothetical protein